MSRYIAVNHKILEQTAADIDECITKHNQYLEQASENVRNMSSIWEGSDYIKYCEQWGMLTNNDSTSKAIIKNMQNYADYLCYCAKKYKEAQANAINKANNIPKW